MGCLLLHQAQRKQLIVYWGHTINGRVSWRGSCRENPLNENIVAMSFIYHQPSGKMNVPRSVAGLLSLGHSLRGSSISTVIIPHRQESSFRRLKQRLRVKPDASF